MDPEVVNMMNALAVESFNKWKDTSTDAQKQVALEGLAKFSTDEEYKNTEMAVFNQQFQDADVNNDGVLDRDEYIVFTKVAEAREAARGGWIMDDDEYTGRFYVAANAVTPGTDGVSMADMMQAIGVVMAKSQELKAAAGL